jgi:hypothetical protein
MQKVEVPSGPVNPAKGANETHCDKRIRSLVPFVIDEEISHGNSDLRGFVKLHMDCSARVVARTTGIFADAVLFGWLTIHFWTARTSADRLGVDLNVHHFAGNDLFRLSIERNLAH